MKTYTPTDWSMTMSEDADGEWIHLEDHLAVLAENALKMKRLEVEIEKLGRAASQFVDLSRLPSDANHFSLLDEVVQK